MKKCVLLIIAFVFLMVAPVQAVGLSAVGGSSGQIPGTFTNELLENFGNTGQLDGFFNASLSVDGPAIVTFEFWGWEAEALNEFLYMGSPIFNTTPGTDSSSYPSAPLGTFTPLASVDGILDFSFRTDYGSGSTVTNASPNAPDEDVNVFISLQKPATNTPEDGTVAWLFLDDAGYYNIGAGNVFDDNHDDMLIRVSVSEVPIPAAAWLLGVGLMGLVGMRRKFSQK
jgi:hypothetical protein